MFRKRASRQEVPDPGTQQGVPAQQVWSVGKKELDTAMAMLLEDEAVSREGRSLASNARLEELLKHLTSAMYSFETLVERGANLEITQPLADGCRRLSEGLLNGDGEDVFEGRGLIVRTMLPLEEERERRRLTGE
jgi:hypothetical protein